VVRAVLKHEGLREAYNWAHGACGKCRPRAADGETLFFMPAVKGMCHDDTGRGGRHPRIGVTIIMKNGHYDGDSDEAETPKGFRKTEYDWTSHSEYESTSYSECDRTSNSGFEQIADHFADYVAQDSCGWTDERWLIWAVPLPLRGLCRPGPLWLDGRKMADMGRAPATPNIAPTARAAGTTFHQPL
jgi:hypothetical protein